MSMKIKIPVKIGSHLTHVNVNDKVLCSDDFVRIALIQCNLIKCANEFLNTYALFERLNGIELMINANTNIYSLWSSKWCNLINDNNFSLIIKKYRKSENLCKFIEKNEKRMHKLFEISRQMSIQNIPSEFGEEQEQHGEKQQNDFLSKTHDMIFKKQDKLKLKLQSIAGNQDKSTSGDSGTTRVSNSSSGAFLIKKSGGKISEKRKFLKKFLCKTDAHAKTLLRNLSNSSFLSISKSKSVATKFENSSYHHYEEITESNLIL
jgi:hypothetical protein